MKFWCLQISLKANQILDGLLPYETMAEIYQKQRTVAERLEKQEQNICEKTQKLFTDAQEQLNKAHEAWEEATKEHMKAVRQKLESTREQLTELQQKVEIVVILGFSGGATGGQEF